MKNLYAFGFCLYEVLDMPVFWIKPILESRARSTRSPYEYEYEKSLL